MRQQDILSKYIMSSFQELSTVFEKKLRNHSNFKNLFLQSSARASTVNIFSIDSLSCVWWKRICVAKETDISFECFSTRFISESNLMVPSSNTPKKFIIGNGYTRHPPLCYLKNGIPEFIDVTNTNLFFLYPRCSNIFPKSR